MSDSKRTALRGHETFTVDFVDGSQETLPIRALPITEYDRYLTGVDDLPKTAALLTGAPMEKIAKIHPDSLIELCRKGEELQEPFFARWLKDRVDRSARIKAHLGVSM